jgi:predicted MPP superfamily phosphohydrolase
VSAVRRSRRAQLGIGGAMLVLVLAIWAFWIEPARLTVHREQLVVPTWPHGASGIRIAILTDLHIGSPHTDLAKLRTIVDRTNAEHPDLICVLGDLVIQGVVGGRFVTPEAMTTDLARLRAPMGVVAVLGNHDGWLDAPRVAAALRSANIRVLQNTAMTVHIPRAADTTVIRIAGIRDMWTDKYDITHALAPTGMAELLLTHNPDVFPHVPAAVRLVLAGHTHGGQVNFPFIGPPIVPSRYGQRYAAGHVVEQGRHLYVATGIGTSILPVRFRVPPAITLLTVVAK